MSRWWVAVLLLLAGCGSDDGGREAVLQLRPVLGAAGDCRDRSENPPAAEPTSMSSKGKCVGLAPSVLSVSEAEVQEVRETESGLVYAHVRLNGKDTSTLEKVSRQFLGKEVAMVAFGRILNAPVFNEPIVIGEMAIVGLSSEDIAALRHALSD